ncbi:RNA-binding protein [filamentous cyanobacterium CCP5]|nr:RNA-binding protein [filamentous cyanobacterium CCP5]
MSENLQAGAQWLQSLLRLQGIETSVKPNLVNNEAGDSCWLVIDESSLSEDQIHHLTGDRGGVLDAVQYLANTILNLEKPQEEQQAFTVELAGYREQRMAELKATAEATAQEVLASGEEREVQGLSSAERRQVHNFLKDYEGLETFSRGKEPDRRLVVKPAEQPAE